jgi:NitT/TauT family transport system substrate-binding protein
MHSHRSCLFLLTTALLASFSLMLAGCGKSAPLGAPGKDGLVKITFQTDWYPQAEHGGFYQALAKGYYKEAGLDVEIVSGGPGSHQQTNIAGFAMSRADDAMFSINQGLPYLIVGAYMEHDIHALMLHAENPVNSFKDLDGKAVMAGPGAPMMQYIEGHYGIKMNYIPLNYGLAQFMSDKNFIQQCFVTSEPYFIEQSGIKVKTMMISAAGYENYRVITTNKRFAREHPELVRAFVAASIKGWDDFMNGDPEPAKAMIKARNTQMPEDLLNYSIQAMKDRKLIGGDPDKGERIGLITRQRLQAQLDTLKSLKIVEPDLSLEKVVDFSFLPADLQPLVGQ